MASVYVDNLKKTERQKFSSRVKFFSRKICIQKYKQKLNSFHELYTGTGISLEQKCLRREGLLCRPIPYPPVSCSWSFQHLDHNSLGTSGVSTGLFRSLTRILFRLITGQQSQILFMVLAWVTKFCRQSAVQFQTILSFLISSLSGSNSARVIYTVHSTSDWLDCIYCLSLSFFNLSFQ